MLLSLDDLRDVRAICEAGSFRQAAMALGLTQPTLSKRVELMERRLNAQLFERARGRSRPTALARLIAERSAGMLDAAASLVTEVERVAAGAGGMVRLGLGPAPMLGLFDSLVHRIRRRMPGVTVSCVTGDTAILMRHLDRREVDFALCVRDPLLVKPHFEAQVLISSQIDIFTAPGHPLVERPPATFEALFSHTVAMPILEPVYRTLAKDRFDVDLGEIPGVIYCSNYHALMDLAIAGSHAVLGPEFAFRRAVRDGVLTATALPADVPHEVHLFTNPETLPIPAVDAVLDILRSDVQSLIESR
jgi:DNA-binding transcriptional LysR family regulator